MTDNSHNKTHKKEPEEKESKEVTEKKQRKSLITILLVIAIVIIIFVAIIIATNIIQKKESQKPLTATRAVYNNYVFNKLSDGYWHVDLTIKNNLYTIPFYYNPYEVENISVDQTALISTMNTFAKNVSRNVVYITMNPDDPSKIVVASVEIARILGNRYDIFNFDTRTAITKQSTKIAANYPVITCQNANETTLVFFIQVSDHNSIDVKNNCITINGQSLNDTIKVSDALALRMLSIIQ